MPAVTQRTHLPSSDYVQTVPEQNNLIMAAMMETSEANTQGKYQENGPWSRWVLSHFSTSRGMQLLFSFNFKKQKIGRVWGFKLS